MFVDRYFVKGDFIWSLSLGIAVNHGRFTEDENVRLRQNVRDFMALTAIDSATKLFFPRRFKQEQQNIKKLKATHRFFERIGECVCVCVRLLPLDASYVRNCILIFFILLCTVVRHCTSALSSIATEAN